MTGKDNKKIPLKWRLKAWWQGYDIADLEKNMRQKEPGEISKKPVQNPVQNPAQDTDEKSDQIDQKILWDYERVKVTQLIWGEGFCGPGGEQNIIDMSKLLALSPKMSAMVIGAGLGGPARVLAKEFGVWINAYESNQILAEEGMKISVTKGLDKKAPIIHNDLNAAPKFDRVFERAFSKETLFTVENKTALIQSIFDQLKDNSLFLISDYVVKNHDSLANADVIDWLKHEPLDPYPTTPETLKYTLEKVGFQIRIHEDITAQYLELIYQAWANAHEVVALLAEGGEEGRKNMFAILNEAELWNRRAKVMRSGELQIYRCLAHKAVQTE